MGKLVIPSIVASGGGGGSAPANVFTYKGSVASYNNLPTSDNKIGDVYNVLDTGKNYAWDGTNWDDLGGDFDVSTLLATQQEFNNSVNNKAATPYQVNRAINAKIINVTQSESFQVAYFPGLEIPIPIVDNIVSIGEYTIIHHWDEDEPDLIGVGHLTISRPGVSVFDAILTYTFDGATYTLQRMGVVYDEDEPENINWDPWTEVLSTMYPIFCSANVYEGTGISIDQDYDDTNYPKFTINAKIPTLTWYTNNTGNTITIASTSDAVLVKIYRNGVLLQPTVGNSTADYTVSGTTLTLTSPLSSSDKITLEMIK